MRMHKNIIILFIPLIVPLLFYVGAVAKGDKTFTVFGIIWFASVFFPYNERRNVSFEFRKEKSVLYHAFHILIFEHIV